jgi:hypothetical protein
MVGTRRSSCASTWGRQRRPGRDSFRDPLGQERNVMVKSPWGDE